MRVPLASFCLACKSKGQPNRLNRELGVEEVFCVDPRTQKALHTFPDIEAAEAYDASLVFLEAPEEDAEPEPAPAPKPKPAPRVEAPKAKAAELDPVPAVVKDPVQVKYETEAAATTKAVREVFEPEWAKEPVPVIAAEATPEIPGLFNTPQSAKVVKFVPPPARKAAGGVLILTVRIPDEHVAFLQSEAISQKETVENYFQRIVEWGLTSRWFY